MKEKAKNWLEFYKSDFGEMGKFIRLEHAKNCIDLHFSEDYCDHNWICNGAETKRWCSYCDEVEKINKNKVFPNNPQSLLDLIIN